MNRAEIRNVGDSRKFKLRDCPDSRVNPSLFRSCSELELSLDSFRLRHSVHGVEGGCQIPGHVGRGIAELTVSSFDVHIEPRRSAPLDIGAKLDSLDGVQGTEARVEAFLRLVTDVAEVRLHLP